MNMLEKVFLLLSSLMMRAFWNSERPLEEQESCRNSSIYGLVTQPTCSCSYFDQEFSEFGPAMVFDLGDNPPCIGMMGSAVTQDYQAIRSYDNV